VTKTARIGLIVDAARASDYHAREAPLSHRRKPPPDRNLVAGLPLKQKHRILKRWGHSNKDMAAMETDEQIAEVQDALRHGIYAGSLPSSPREDSEKPILLDEETGQPIEISDLLKRPEGQRHCIMRVPEPATRSCSYEEALTRFQKDETLDSADHRHLNRLAADSRMIKHWEEIERIQSRQMWAASPGWLIWHILVARRAAEFFGDYPQKQRHAENAENLARYLRKTGETDEPTCRLLEDLALKLRRPEALEPFETASVPVSRKGTNINCGHRAHNTREVRAFINFMTNHFKSTYGRPFYGIVATLTDSAFPGRVTTIDHVRNAVKPTRQKDRLGKR
jgi:hypothetical protein